MKYLIILAVLLVSGACHSQTYRYYFFNISATGSKGVTIATEKDMAYPEVDSLIVSTREGKKVTYKYFTTNTDAYNTLSKAGLEFVSFMSDASILGAATLWRKRL